MKKQQLGEGQVQVGDRKIGPETVIQINLKTLLIVLGFLLSGLTTAWWNLSDKITDSEKKSSADVQEIKNDIKQLRSQELKSISDQVGQVDGKLLDFFIKLQTIHNNQNPGNVSAPTENLPIDNQKPRIPGH